MKKFLIALLALFAFTLSASALADGGITNPYFYEAQRPRMLEMGADKGAAYAAATAPTLRIQCTQSPTRTTPGSWSVTATGGSYASYEFAYYITCDESWNPDDRGLDPHGFRAASSATSYSYKFIVPGDYRIYVYAYAGSTCVQTAYQSFSIAAEDGWITTEQRAQQIVDQCRAAGVTGAYETALWLHDWMIQNACYDLTYSYYSADSILIRGTGVCDGYSKAYMILLRLAGIEARRVTGGNHAWNCVRLDGEWYQIDPTWDDPVTSYDTTNLAPVSGAECHYYFGLTDAAMRVDHSYTPSVACIAYADNYFIRSGKVSMWSEPIRKRLQAQLDAGATDFTLTLSSAPARETAYSFSDTHIAYPIAAYALEQLLWRSGSGWLKVTLSYADSNRSLEAHFLPSDYGIIELPAGLTTIEASAFRNADALMGVVIPDGATTIGSKAFADCELLGSVEIPSSVTSIAEDAFENSPNVSFICADGSKAADYADAHDIRHTEPAS